MDIHIIVGLILLGVAYFYKSWEGNLVWNRGSWIGQTITAGPAVVAICVGIALSQLGLAWYFAGAAAFVLYSLVQRH